MSLADALNAQPRRTIVQRCPIAAVLKQLDDNDLPLLLAALADKDRTARSIAHALASIGLPVSPDGVQRHRRKACACEPR